jgi:hypothetical protein
MNSSLYRATFVVGFAVACTGTPAQAQSSADAVVGLQSGSPLFVRQIDGHTVNALALAAGVPMGLEGAREGRRLSPTIVATGKKLREVLDAMTVADPRYTWRDDDGVIVIYPTGERPVQSLLNSQVGSLARRDVFGAHAHDAVRALFGQPGMGVGTSDTRQFSFEIAEGSTLEQLLNAIVRAHGEGAWTFAETVPRNADLPLTLWLFGYGGTLPKSAVLRRTPVPIPSTQGHSPATGVPVALLDRVVEEPVTVFGYELGSDVIRLAAAVGVPMGIQTIPADIHARARELEGFRGVTVTGMPLRAALAAVTATDARYEWRELDGMIVVRPASAWQDPHDPLFRIVPSIQLADVTADAVLGELLGQLHGPERRRSVGFSDTRPFSVDFPQGTLLDALNTIVKSHGAMSWHWDELSEAEKRDLDPRFPGKWRLTFTVFSGVGSGFVLP